jgi:uncharacterized membrane protein YgdD (TMEM256/DUF423 family)
MNFIACGALANAIGVILLAFSTHILKTRLSIEMMTIYDLAVRFIFIHAFALIAVGFLTPRFEILKMAAWLFILGIIFFCGSLFALIFTHIRGIGFLSPLGGICFVAGWIFLAYICIKNGP